MVDALTALFQEPLAGAVFAILAVIIGWVFRWIFKATEARASTLQNDRNDLTKAEIQFRAAQQAAIERCISENQQLRDQLQDAFARIDGLHQEIERLRRERDG